MKANFRSIHSEVTEYELEQVADHLGRETIIYLPGSFRDESELPPGYENYVCIDVVGKEFRWLNDNYPKEQYEWYLWFESVFLVTPEMATFLKLRWS